MKCATITAFVLLLLPILCLAQSNTCSPVGTWNWMDGHTAYFHEDGTASNRNNGATARWTSLGRNRIRVVWSPGGWTDTVAFSADCGTLAGTNNAGREIRVTRQHAASSCNAVGTWNWVDANTVVFNADGTGVNRSIGATARWVNSGANQIRVTWSPGGWVDTLTFTSGCNTLQGTNNAGRQIRVTRQHAASSCNAAGTWNWVDANTVDFNADGTGVNRSIGATARWINSAANQIRVTWSPGGWVDTLTFTSDCNTLQGTNNVGRQIRVTRK